MKRISLLLIIVVAGLCVTGFASAQEVYGDGNSANGPSHPLKPAFGQPRILADTAIIRTYVEMGGQPMYPSTWMDYKFHENNLIDSICPATNWTIFKYSEKGQLLSHSSYVPARYVPGLLPSDPMIYVEPREVLYREFEYGEDGRLLKSIYYLFEDDSSYVSNIYTYTYAMTDSGYVAHVTAENNATENYSVEFFLDNQGRVIRTKDPQSKDEYVFDSEGRRFRVGDNYYFYFDNGYSLLSYYHRGVMVWGAPDTWARIDYFFQEHGYLSKKLSYLMEEGETEWKVYNHDEWEYRYKADNPLPNATIEEQPESTVYAIDGAVIVDIENAATVNVYSFSGQLVTQQRVSAGINHIALAKGLYIISLNGKGYKVAVK